MTYLEILQHQLPIDEGMRTKPYRDTVGKLTAGVGRNLDDVPFSADEIALMLENDIRRAEQGARALVPTFDTLTEERKAVMVNMTFNMGRAGLANFVHFLEAVDEGRWDDAATQMLASKWATQVGPRAQRLAAAMKGI